MGSWFTTNINRIIIKLSKTIAMTQSTIQSDLDTCKDSIEKFKTLAFEAEQDYQFSLAAGDFEKVASAKKRLSLYRKEIGALVKIKLSLMK